MLKKLAGQHETNYVQNDQSGYASEMKYFAYQYIVVISTMHIFTRIHRYSVNYFEQQKNPCKF